MVAHSAETVGNKREFELLWHRHGPRGLLFMPDGYESFAFRPGGQAGYIWDYFHEIPQDFPVTTTPANAPGGTDPPGFIFGSTETNNAHLDEGESDERDSDHSSIHPLSSSPTYEEDRMEGWEPYGSVNSEDHEADSEEMQDAEDEVKSKSHEVTEAEAAGQSGFGGLDGYEHEAI